MQIHLVQAIRMRLVHMRAMRRVKIPLKPPLKLIIITTTTTFFIASPDLIFPRHLGCFFPGTKLVWLPPQGIIEAMAITALHIEVWG